jgi:predicted nucleotidyltransferase
MNRDQVIAILREHELELRAAGIAHLAIFGSAVRGNDKPESDIDLLVSFDDSKPASLLTVGRLKRHLADLLGTKVDLSSPSWLKDSIGGQVLREAIDAF